MVWQQAVLAKASKDGDTIAPRDKSGLTFTMESQSPLLETL